MSRTWDYLRLERSARRTLLSSGDLRLHPDLESTLAADEELRRAAQIEAQTLRFHRQSTHPTRTTSEELVTSVIGLYRGRLMNSQITTEIKQGPGATFVCFEGEIRQILNNLVANAIDVMRHSGRLVVRTRRATDYRSSRDGVSISIADTGHGMESAVVRQVFEAFFTTKAIMHWTRFLDHKGIVEKHHGHLTVRSRPQRVPASRFSFPIVCVYVSGVISDVECRISSMLTRRPAPLDMSREA